MTMTSAQTWAWRAVLFALVVGVPALLARRCGAPSAAAGDAGAFVRAFPDARALRGKPKTQRELPTTSADIYLGNLDEQIGELTRLTRERPQLLDNLMMLSAAHHSRGRLK